MQADRYQDRYQDGGFASDDEMDRGGSSRRGEFSGDEGGSKSFRGWGKFSKPSTWGTKTKRVSCIAFFSLLQILFGQGHGRAARDLF